MIPCLKWLIIKKCPKLKALPHRLLRKESSLECIMLDEKKYEPSKILPTYLTIADIQAGQRSPPDPEPTANLGHNIGPKSYPEWAKNAECKYCLTSLYTCRDCCHFYHPQDHSEAVAATMPSGAETLEQVVRTVCQNYTRTEMCKFCASCKCHHPRQGGSTPTLVTLNINGYPLQPGENERSFYRETEQLKVHVTCKFYHPQSASPEVPAATPVPETSSATSAAPVPEIHAVASSSTHPIVRAVPAQCLSVASSAGPSSSSRKEQNFSEA